MSTGSGCRRVRNGVRRRVEQRVENGDEIVGLDFAQERLVDYFERFLRRPLACRMRLSSTFTIDMISAEEMPWPDTSATTIPYTLGAISKTS